MIFFTNYCILFLNTKALLKTHTFNDEIYKSIKYIFVHITQMIQKLFTRKETCRLLHNRRILSLFSIAVESFLLVLRVEELLIGFFVVEEFFQDSFLLKNDYQGFLGLKNRLKRFQVEASDLLQEPFRIFILRVQHYFTECNQYLYCFHTLCVPNI